MNNRTLIGALAVIVVLALLGGGWYIIARNTGSTSPAPRSNSSSSQATNNTAPQSPAPAPSSNTPTTPSMGAATTESVTIMNFAFSPASITVKKGTKVTWTNKDSIAHTVTESDGQSGGPDSSTLQQGDAYSFTFNTAGTFHYQ